MEVPQKWMVYEWKRLSIDDWGYPMVPSSNCGKLPEGNFQMR
jgi:hypothetical protein